MSDLDSHGCRLIDVIVVLEDFSVSNVNLVDFPIVNSSELLQDSTHCFLFVAHPERIRYGTDRELVAVSLVEVELPLLSHVFLDGRGGSGL